MTSTFPGFQRITATPGQLNGQPCIRGTRLSVRRVIELLAENPNWEDLRVDYPSLEPEDIGEALRFAATCLPDASLSLRVAG